MFLKIAILFLVIYILLVIARGLHIVVINKKTYSKNEYEKLLELSKKHNNVNKLNNIPIVWINLERSKERRNYMETQFKKYNITNHKRIEACDGNSLDNVLGRGKLCGIEFYNKRKMKKAELGCTLSHIKCIMEAENRGDEYTIICEDDINMVTMRFWDFTIKDIINKLPHDWTILQISDISSLKRGLKDMFGLKYVKYPQKVHILKNEHKFGATMYIINERGRRNILEKLVKDGIVILDNSTPYISIRKNIGTADDVIYACNKKGYYSTTIPLFLVRYSPPSTIKSASEIFVNYSNYSYSTIINKSVKKYGKMVLK
jgi:GR25 family glycosyltransferase involved in LPS biosynthesis